MSTATLAAAFAAAWFAKRAADETKRGANEAARSADAAYQANRPWLMLKPPKICFIQVDPKEPKARFIVIRSPVEVRNFGNSPAFRISIGYAISLDHKTAAAVAKSQVFENHTALKKSAIYASGEFTDIGLYHFLGLKVPEDFTRSNFIENPASWVISLYVGYHSITGDNYYTGDQFQVTGIVNHSTAEIECTIVNVFGGGFSEAT
ncbi:hypothetical protein KX816_14650 [Sphingosinicellaceae bacterium]|nr:hypothetical protein KX816_14650 [Sphingosinicellaceae bacterium]